MWSIKWYTTQALACVVWWTHALFSDSTANKSLRIWKPNRDWPNIVYTWPCYTTTMHTASCTKSSRKMNEIETNHIFCSRWIRCHPNWRWMQRCIVSIHCAIQRAPSMHVYINKINAVFARYFIHNHAMPCAHAPCKFNGIQQEQKKNDGISKKKKKWTANTLKTHAYTPTNMLHASSIILQLILNVPQALHTHIHRPRNKQKIQ